jgi:putative sugar O-methyltransferase
LTSDDSIARYKDALYLATTKDDAFKQFRRLAGLREIVEGIPDVVGRGYHEKLRSHIGEAALKAEWLTIVENDRHGNPELVELVSNSPYGKAASTTMRYAWNVFDMMTHDIALDDVDIVEVGGGYGGLCRMIHAFHKPKSYTIVDLPEALGLADRYLKCYGIEARMVASDAYGLEPIDTFISNYALTELSKDVQDGYANKLLKRADFGYVTYNSQPRNAGNQYSLADLKAMAPGITETYEENVKRSECQVLVWRPR